MFQIPTSDSGPNFIVAGPDGNLWFTEFRGNKIARITPAGVISEFPLAPNPASPEFGSNVPNGITTGPDGNLWFTELFGNRIGRITTAGVITEFPVPHAGASPYGIAAGPDGNLWFTEENGNRIGRIALDGTITEFSLPGSGTPLGIAAGADGNLWFTEQGGNKIGRITTAGAIVEFQVPSPNTAPFGISAGPDGNLWFTEETGNRIGRITPGGTITEFPLPNGGTPIGIALGPDGNLWFTEDSRDTIGKITPAGVITEFAAQGGSTENLAAGPDGNLWFTDQTGNRIGKAQVPALPTCTTAVSISLLLPSHGGNAGQVTTQIYGCAFNSAAQVRLTGLGADIPGANTTVTGATVLTTTFDLTGASPGARNVVITNPDGTTATLIGGFTVEQGGAAQITVDIIGRNAIRIGSPQTFYISVGNRGNIDSALVTAWLTFPAYLVWDAEHVSTSGQSADGRNQLSFLVPIEAGTTKDIPITLTAPNDPGVVASIQLAASARTAAPTGIQITGDRLTSTSLTSSSTCAFDHQNHISGVNSVPTPPAVVAGLAFNEGFRDCDLVTMIAVAGAESQFKAGLEDGNYCSSGTLLSVDRGLWQINSTHSEYDAQKLLTDPAYNAHAARQIYGSGDFGSWYTYQSGGYIFYWSTAQLAAESYTNQCTITRPEPFDVQISGTTVHTQLVSSLDPNDKVGPHGSGTSQFLSGQSSTPYSVYFENQATATAPAQAVTITDTLNTNLDQTTLILGPITFPNQVITPPSIPLSIAPFSATVDLRPTSNLLVKINASLNTTTRVLTWVFQSLDPATNQPPTDPLAGFLPPGAEGSVFFTVMPKSTVTTGTGIQNTATVVFDVNPPINTPTWFNTIDNTKPTSHANLLPATQTTTSFSVSWAGSDVGAGVQDFTVYASDNGGVFTPWQNNTTATSATFSGTVGHTYRFYTVARDLVGNVENSKSTAEATTTLVSAPTVQCTGCYFLINGIRATVAFNVSAVGSTSSFAYNYRTPAQIVQFVSTTTSAISESGKTATFSGQGTLNGVTGYSFTVVATDGGGAGSGLDTVSLTFTGPNNYTYTASGTIVGGDINVH